jgi:hypothetical protein
MVHNHAEAVLLKESIKLNIAMLEKAECILSGAKDKEVIYSLIDNLWHLINRSRLMPTHQQELTRVLMNMKRDRDMGQHLELEHVLNQIITVFGDEDEQQEVLAAMLASTEQLDSRSGYRQREYSPPTQTRDDTQKMAKLQDTIDKMNKNDMRCQIRTRSTSQIYCQEC